MEFATKWLQLGLGQKSVQGWAVGASVHRLRWNWYFLQWRWKNLLLKMFGSCSWVPFSFYGLCRKKPRCKFSELIAKRQLLGVRRVREHRVKKADTTDHHLNTGRYAELQSRTDLNARTNTSTRKQVAMEKILILNCQFLKIPACLNECFPCWRC